MSANPTSLAASLAFLRGEGETRPLTDADAENPMHSTNPFSLAFTWYTIGYLVPGGPKGLSKLQTTSTKAVFENPFPHAPDKSDPDLGHLTKMWLAYCRTEAGSQYLNQQRHLSEIMSSKILGEITAALMNKCKTDIVYAAVYSRSDDKLKWTAKTDSPRRAIEIVENRAQKLYESIFAKRTDESGVTRWKNAFVYRASHHLSKGTEELSGVAKATATSILNDWSILETGKDGIRVVTEADGSSARTQMPAEGVESGASAGSQAISSDRSAEMTALMKVFEKKLQEMESLKAASARSEPASLNAK
jgi:hypothetical protein